MFFADRFRQGVKGSRINPSCGAPALQEDAVHGEMKIQHGCCEKMPRG